MGPLAGLAIVEMAGLGPCPLAGQLLADLGAAVTVIDRHSGQDFSRDVNRRGKRSIVLDLKQADGAAIALKLIKRGDAVIEGFRPGVMERLGLGPESCLAANPALVYGRITGWGQSGPLAHTAGHDITYLASTGALFAMGDGDRPPAPPLNLVADYGGGGMFLVFGVLAGLLEASRSGRGQVVDAAMVDGVPAMMGLIHTLIAKGAWSHRRADNMLDGGAPYYACYETADGKFVAVGALEPQFFDALVAKTGIDPAWTRLRTNRDNWPALRAELTAVFASRSRDEWAAHFAGSDACVGPVLDFGEAMGYAHAMERGAYFESAGVPQAAPAPRFSRSVAEQPAPGGAAGADGESIMAMLGYGAAEIADCRNRGILG